MTQLICGGRYEVGPLLRRGATGVVHGGRWLDGGEWVTAVFKIEACAAPRKQMQREVAVYRALRRKPRPPPSGTGFARCEFDSGPWKEGGGDVNVLCMEALGPNLGDVIAARGPVSAEAAASIARRLVLCLKELHERTGHAHRDVKPANVCVGSRGAGDGRLFLIDFGLAAPFEASDGRHCPAAPAERRTGGRRVHGSVKYLSVRAHESVEAHGDARLASRSRRCDLEAVARAPANEKSARTFPQRLGRAYG